MNLLEQMRQSGLGSEMLNTLTAEWGARVKDLEREHYDPYADVLYVHLLEGFTDKKDDIFTTLRNRMQTARSPKEIEVPIWSYVAGYSKRLEAPLAESRVGTGSVGLPPVSVYKVLHATDLLHRVASAFGADFYVYDRYTETLSETDQGCLTRRELVLAYYPYGLPQVLSDRIQTAYVRQLGRTPYRMTYVEQFTLTDPLRTPPQSPVNSPPRLIQRRCYCEHETP
jgi:hypothetical protein